MSEFFDNGFYRDPRAGFVSKTRIAAVAVAIGIVFMLYIGHLFSLQVVEGSEYAQRAQEITRRSAAIASRRGEILDRNGKPIATNIDAFTLMLNPADVPRDGFTGLFERLAPILGITTQRLEQRVPTNIRRQYREIELQAGLDLETITEIAERIDQFPGLSWISQPLRHYPDGYLLSHVAGYLGAITPQELQVLFNHGYGPGSVLGKTGIEREYDGILRGQDGRGVRFVDAFGREVEQPMQSVLPELGNNLVLTIDRDIQELAAKSLGERTGAVAVVRVATGEILALYSFPGYDANQFMVGSDDAVFSRLSQDPRSPFLNRAIQTEVPAASTFKIIMATAALEEEVFGVDHVINTRGTYQAGNQTFREWGLDVRPQGFGPLNIIGALANSSNFFFYTVGHEFLGADRISRYAKLYGLGQPTGIDIPGERSGTVPSPYWKENTLGERWVGGDTVNFSIGQGYLTVTPLQMANVMAMVANRGVIYRPHIVAEMRDPTTGEVLDRTEPEVLHDAPIRESTFASVAEGLRQAVTDGTARGSVTTRAVESVGKTGTGEIGRSDRWHSWYVAYAPYEPVDPMEQVAIAVLVDADNDYDFWAARAANLIMHGIFTNLNYEDTVRDLRPWYLPWRDFM